MCQNWYKLQIVTLYVRLPSSTTYIRPRNKQIFSNITNLSHTKKISITRLKDTHSRFIQKMEWKVSAIRISWANIKAYVNECVWCVKQRERERLTRERERERWLWRERGCRRYHHKHGCDNKMALSCLLLHCYPLCLPEVVICPLYPSCFIKISLLI